MMKHNYFSRKHGLMLAIASVLSFNAYSQIGPYTWTGTTDSEFSTLANWKDDVDGSVPTSFANTFAVNAGAVVSNNVNVSNASLNVKLNGGKLTLKKLVQSNTFVVTDNSSVLNLINEGAAELTLINNRVTAGTSINAGTLNVGNGAANASVAVLNSKGTLYLGSGAGNVLTVNVYPDGRLNAEGASPIRIKASKDNGEATVNMLGGTINSNVELQLGEKETGDIGKSTLNLISGVITVYGISLPRDAATTPNVSRAYIYNGILNAGVVRIGTNGKIEFKVNTNETAPTGVLNTTTTTKEELQAFIDAGKIVKPTGYDWKWGTTGGVNLSVVASTTPIKLVSFTTATASNGVNLNWVTSSEKDNAEFVLSHSTDGKAFSKLVSIAGKNAASTYAYVHKNPANGNNYYKLTQVDFNGTEEAVGIRSANFSISGALGVNVFPNPASDVLNVTVAGKENSVKDITVLDLNGKVVLRETSSDATVQLNLKGKALNGTYIVNVKADEISESKKVVIQ